MRYQSFKLLLFLIALALLSACDPGGFNPRSTSQLAALSVEGGTLDPAFSSDQQSYRLTLDNSGKPLTFTPLPAHDLATVTINGQPVASGKKSPPLTVAETPYTTTIRVVSPDESRVTEYRIVILRPGDTVPGDLGSNTTPSPAPTVTSEAASLASLKLSNGALTQTFNPASTSYDATVNYLTTTTALTATPSDTAATVTINGTPVKAPDYRLTLPLQTGENRIEITVRSADGKDTTSYKLTIVRASADRFIQQSILKAGTAQAHAKFGFSMAIAGTTAAIAAPEATVAGKLAAGSVHIFHLIDGNWIEVQELTETTPKTGNRFGYSIAMNSDTLAISAFGYDGRRKDSGIVYLYQTDSGGTWQLQSSSLQSPQSIARERFGYNIALSGNNMAVATLRGDDGARGGGDVYLYRRNNDSWEFLQRIDIAGSSDRFGQSVVIDGDLLAIGSFADDNECRNKISDSGTVTLYRFDGTQWQQETALKADNAGGGDRFGFSIALADNTLAVAAICEDSLATTDNNSGIQAGAVYVFTQEGTTWRQRAYIKEPTPRNHNLFGFRIALNNDLLAVGAPLDDSNGEDAGIAYLYQGSGSDWKAIRTIEPTDAEAFDEFGVDLELADGNLLIGSIQTQQKQPSATGKVYSFR